MDDPTHGSALVYSRRKLGEVRGCAARATASASTAEAPAERGEQRGRGAKERHGAVRATLSVHSRPAVECAACVAQRSTQLCMAAEPARTARAGAHGAVQAGDGAAYTRR